MPRLVREQISIPTVLKGILDNYPAGAATLREFLQNTDDCGATIQNFILDTRTFSTDRLISPALERCQGPALIATNNGLFKETDWVAITKINNSSKTTDETSTGKFGLGFRSCYHVTDTPQILSGDRLYILDPHESVEEWPGGIDLETAGEDREKFSSHFETFASIIPYPRERAFYNGTAIRLPLRVEAQAQNSQIKKMPTSIADVRKMFEDFARKELPEAMLFLKNISSITLSEIGEDGHERVFARAWIENADSIASIRNRHRGRQGETSHLEFTLHVEVNEAETTQRWLVSHFVEDYDITAGIMAARLGQPLEDIRVKMTEDKLLPHVALAVALPDSNLQSTTFVSIAGKLFTLLPLPIDTGFPAHLHSVLALTSSRQNLRNYHDITPKSREEFLVEWNRAIFTDLAPKAWAGMLEYITNMSRALDPLALWPKSPKEASGDQSYWKTLPSELLNFAVSKDIWRVAGGNRDAPRYLSLDKVLVAPLGFNEGVIETLKLCGVWVTCVPKDIYGLIKSSPHSSAIASPVTVRQRLAGRNGLVTNLAKGHIRSLCDYIATGDDLKLLLNIPLHPTVAGTHVSVTLRESYTFTLADKQEAALFHTVDPSLLAREEMSPKTAELLQESDRIRALGPVNVVRYLKTLFGRFPANVPSVFAGVRETEVDWLVIFWQWVNRWAKAPQLLDNYTNEIQNLHLLPLGRTTGLRRCSDKAIHPAHVDQRLLSVLHEVKMPILHTNVPSDGEIIKQMIASAHSIPYLLKQHSSHQNSLPSLSQQTRNVLHEHYLRCFGNTQYQLTLEQKKILRLLPIFPVVPAGTRKTDRLPLASAPETSLFINDAVEIVPNLPGTHFIDALPVRDLLNALQCGVTPEKKVLEFAIAHWTHQGPELAKLFVGKILSRMNDIPPTARDTLRTLPIVEVGRETPLFCCPAEVVDPQSPIASLYDPDDAVLPTGSFAQDGPGSYLQQLRNYNMLRTDLSPAIVENRIHAIVDPHRTVKERDKKALALLDLLDKSFTSNYPPGVTKIIVESPWLPVADNFFSAAECWDRRHRDIQFCDLVLNIVGTTLTSADLRNSIGWTRVPFETIIRQFVNVLDGKQPHPRARIGAASRVTTLLLEIADRYEDRTCTEEDIDRLLEAIGDRAWVPISGSKCAHAEKTILSPTKLGQTFHHVAGTLSDDKTRVLLQRMGILERPSVGMLRSELFTLSTKSCTDAVSRRGLVDDALAILEELTCRVPDLDPSDILVPTAEFTLQPAKIVVYNDLRVPSSSMPEGTHAAHPSVSPALATNLRLLSLSDERFSQDEGEFDTFEISEDLSKRIEGVLKGYDIEYASNEWVANADDANASEMGMLLDELTFGTSSLISPNMAEFQRSPALIIHNDGIFSDEDFLGLGRIGLGGKSDSFDKIGRFGLGALSFYHFTEVPMVVSADSVLFLDPSGNYLPRQASKDRRPRPGIKMKLDLCRIKYPDQLRCLDGMFKFSSSQSYYGGTIFRLPLRTVGQAEHSKLSTRSFSILDINSIVLKFFNLAAHSLFFSRITHIEALRRAPDGNISHLWDVKGTRSPIVHSGEPAVHEGVLIGTTNLEMVCKLGSDDAQMEEWLITRSRPTEDMPDQFKDLVSKHRLPVPTAAIALKVRPPPSASQPHSRLFATLPLPITTSLPVHLHAPWILSDDRRSIRYDAADAKGERPKDSLYNEYLMDHVIPPLYFDTLAKTASVVAKRVYHSYWPVKLSWSDARGAIGDTITKSFYRYFAVADQPVCQTVTGAWIAPKHGILHIPTGLGIGRLLEELRIPVFVRSLPAIDRALVAWDTLRTDDPDTVGQILRDNQTDVCRLLRPGQCLERLGRDIFSKVLKYLLGAQYCIVGIPLLQLGNEDVVNFGDAEAPAVFASDVTEISQFFGRARVIGPAISGYPDVVEAIVKAKTNVQKLDVQGARELLGCRGVNAAQMKEVDNSMEAIRWYREVLQFLHRVDSVDLAELDDMPLVPTLNGTYVVSLGYARGGHVLRRMRVERWGCPTQPLIDLGVTIIQDFGLTALLPRPQEDEQPLTEILKAICSLPDLQQRVASRVTHQEWFGLAEWIRQRLSRGSVRSLRQDHFLSLIALPLFEAQRHAQPRLLCAANDVKMLPRMLDPADVGAYLPHAQAFAPFSESLHAVLSREPLNHLSLEVGTEQFMQLLQIPAVIPEDQTQNYRRLLQIIIMLHHGHYNQPLIPDESRTVRVPTSMYDHGVEVFSNALHGRPHLFVHQDFRNIVNLTNLGIRTRISAPLLVICARALDEDTRNGINTAERAGRFWQFYNSDDSRQHVREEDFTSLCNLRFIRAHPSRHEHFGAYARDLPTVVSPNEVALTVDLPVVWTQRAAFAQRPSQFLTSMMTSLGKPTTEEVVSHLVVLSTVIAPDHPSDLRLLADIKATYKWLKANVDDARAHLQQCNELPIWLNVDDPESAEPWVWRRADQLVFGLSFDGEGGRYDVREFLSRYESLLVAAGAKAFRHARISETPAATTQASRLQRLQTGWNDLREGGHLFDIQFNVEGEVILAHKGMLAAMIDHFKTALTGGYMESGMVPSEIGLPVYPLDAGTSAFAVRSVVEYVYTGTFVNPPCSSPEEAGPALAGLLDLLELANLWDMSDLLWQAENSIVNLQLIRAETLRLIRRRAEMVGAARLVVACDETRANNDWAQWDGDDGGDN